MKNIYLPLEDIENTHCIYVYDKDTIRVHKNDMEYTDYFVNSHYLEKPGIELLDENINCLDISIFTNDFYFRNDFPQILLMFFIFIFICYFIVSKLLKALFLGFR